MVEVGATPAKSEAPKSLSDMIYSGRGITMGMTPKGLPFVGYTLSGRSPSSKARRLDLEAKEGLAVISTKPTDMTVLQKGNPALLLYPVIMANVQKIAISNGVQTELAFKAPLLDALAGPAYVNGIDVTSYEPDAPNYTPRITGELKPDQDAWISVFHIVRRDSSGKRLRELHQYELRPGTARTMTTYAGSNESPLLPFTSAPMEMQVSFNDSREICRHLFSVLRGAGQDDYRVSAAAVTWHSAPDGEISAGVSILNVCDSTDNPQVSQLRLRRT